MALISGTLCTLKAKNETIPIRGRRVPQTIGGPRAVQLEDIHICDIPDGAQVLYISSKVDDFNAAMCGKGKGPYNYTPAALWFYFVLWNDRPIWVCSGDCELKPC